MIPGCGISCTGNQPQSRQAKDTESESKTGAPSPTAQGEIATENDKPRAEGLQEVGFERRVGGAGKDKTPEGANPTGVLLNELAWQ